MWKKIKRWFGFERQELKNGRPHNYGNHRQQHRSHIHRPVSARPAPLPANRHSESWYDNGGYITGSSGGWSSCDSSGGDSGSSGSCD